MQPRVERKFLANLRQPRVDRAVSRSTAAKRPQRPRLLCGGELSRSEVCLERGPARGATIVDWNRQSGRPDAARILLRYDQAAFEARIRRALAAG